MACPTNITLDKSQKDQSMKSRILAFAGSKQSGKSTATNFLHGYQLRSHLVIDDFGITDEGKLVIDTNMIGADGEESKGQGFFYLQGRLSDKAKLTRISDDCWALEKQKRYG